MEQNIDNAILSFSSAYMKKMAKMQPKGIDKIIFSNDLVAKLSNIQKAFSKTSQNVNYFSSLTPQLAKISSQLDKKYYKEISAFGSISTKINQIFDQQKNASKSISFLSAFQNPTLDKLRTIYSYNAFIKYNEVYNKFGGIINPENINVETIQKVLEENDKDLKEINEAFIKKIKDEDQIINVPSIIYDLLVLMLPGLSKKYYSYIVAVYIVTVHIFFVYSEISTNTSFNKLDSNTKKIDDQLINQEKILRISSEHFEKTNEINEKIKEKEESFEKFQIVTNEKVDLLFKEMKKIQRDK